MSRGCWAGMHALRCLSISLAWDFPVVDAVLHRARSRCHQLETFRCFLCYILLSVGFSGAIYILAAKIVMSDSSPRDFSEDAFNFWGLSAISFWMSIVLILDR